MLGFFQIHGRQKLKYTEMVGNVNSSSDSHVCPRKSKRIISAIKMTCVSLLDAVDCEHFCLSQNFFHKIVREIWSIMTHQSKLSGLPNISKITQAFNVSLGSHSSSVNYGPEEACPKLSSVGR